MSAKKRRRRNFSPEEKAAILRRILPPIGLSTPRLDQGVSPKSLGPATRRTDAYRDGTRTRRRRAARKLQAQLRLEVCCTTHDASRIADGRAVAVRVVAEGQLPVLSGAAEAVVGVVDRLTVSCVIAVSASIDVEIATPGDQAAFLVETQDPDKVAVEPMAVARVVPIGQSVWKLLDL